MGPFGRPLLSILEGGLRMVQARAGEKWIHTARGRLFAKVWEDGTAEAGPRAPIVLFHDSLGCVEVWRSFPAQLSQAIGCAVIAYDRLGFGRSDPRSDKLGSHFVHDEANVGFSPLRKQLGIRDFVALGHSIGGGMAVVAAGANPGECHALITMSAQAFVEDRTVEGIRAAKKDFMRPGQLDRLRRYHGDKAEWVLNAWTETWLDPEFASWNLDEDLPRVRCPSLIIHGENDEYGSRRQPERIAALVAGPPTVELVPDCGHVPYREREGEVLAMIRAFLARH